MADVIIVIAVVVFFVLCELYARGCARI